MQLGNEINAEPSDIGNQPTTDEIRTFSFSVALGQLKAGKRVARKGWNGKGMWLFLVPGSKFTVQEGRPLAAHIPVGTHVKYHAHVDMKTATGDIVPWLCSQTDLLAEDWVIV